MGLLSLFRSSKSVVVVDVTSLFNALGMKGDVSPRTQLQVLRRLTRFAEREEVELIAVLSGEPLHKAPNRKKFDSILVLYSKSSAKHAGFVAKTALKRGALLLTDDVKVEKLAGASVEKMRLEGTNFVVSSSATDTRNFVGSGSRLLLMNVTFWHS